MSPDAHHDAMAAAERAGVDVAELAGGSDFVAASDLLAGVWGTPPDASPIASDLLASLAHAGACLMGARSAGDLAGVAVCLGGPPLSTQTYSIIAGVSAEVAGRGVGAALKLAQRAWAIERGATTMRWTFDPLVARNAHFNINTLGARATGYEPDFYPPMHDEINRGDLTDRLVVDWNLLDPGHGPARGDGAVPALGRDAAGGPLHHDVGDAETVLVAIPRDIESLRRSDPARGREWRLALRESLGGRLAGAFTVSGFTADGSYVLQRRSDA